MGWRAAISELTTDGRPHPDRLRAYAAEIVGLAPEAIFCNSTPVLAALRKETQTIPIVFTGISIPSALALLRACATGRKSYRICEFRAGDGRGSGCRN